MKMPKIAVVAVLSLIGNASSQSPQCHVAVKNSVICSSESEPGQMSVYWRKKNGSWVRKFWMFGDENYQSVYVRTYKNFNYYETCVNLELYEILKDKNDYTDSEYNAVKKKCKSMCDSLIYDIKSGNKIYITNFDLGFSSDYEEPFSMNCAYFSYVETRKYNKKGVVTGKKNYELMPGDYCRKFLTNDNVYWEP